MNPIILTIILVPVLEIYLLIKIGSQIGAITTILLIFTTAIIGIYYAKYEGLNTLRTGLSQLIKNEIPAYEMISGAAIAFAAILLIIPGFATDLIGFFLIFPITRKLLFGKFVKNFKGGTKTKNVKDYISKYQLNIDINSKPLKAQIIEINTLLKFHDNSESKKKSHFEITYSTVIKLNKEIKDKNILQKIVLCDVQK